MYKIGTFSRITGLTIKALHHYHKEGILEPIYIDVKNGYRFYKKEQIELAKTIKMLRDCTFTVNEIKEILCSLDHLEDLSYYMDEKIITINMEVERLKTIKKQLIYEKKKQKDVKQMNTYEVITKTFDPVMVLSLRYSGRYDECGQYMGQLYKVAKGNSKDVPMNLYYDEEYKEANANIEVCLPIKKELKGLDQIKFRILPEEEGLSVLHIGPYDTVGLAYEALADHANKEQLELKKPSREVYRKGPGMLFKGNPNKYVTEIFIPFK